MPKSKNTKTDTAPKKESKSKSNTKVTKKNAQLNECVAFVYGGSLMKSSNVYVFAVGNKDVAAYAREHLIPFYGAKVNGRYVNCENAKETLESVIKLADKKGFCAETDCNILKINVNNASALLKEASGTNTAHNLKLDVDVSKNVNKNDTKKHAVKKVKKDDSSVNDASEDNDDDDDDEDEDEDEDEEEEDNDDDDDEDNDDEKDVSNDESEEEEDGSESESEEEEKPKLSRKSVVKKGNDKPAKSDSNNKKSEKSKNVKPRK